MFQLKKTEFSTRKERVNHIITLKELELKSLFLIFTKPKKQQFIKDYFNDLLRKK